MARRERKRASARRRIETHESGGGGSNYLKVPEGYSFFQAKPGKYRLDFMCYEVKKGKDEDGGNPFFAKGELAYERTFFVHRGIGPNNDWHLCAAKTFGEPCPICEFRAKKFREPDVDEELMKELAPKERQLWLPVDLADPDQKYIWEFSHHLFGKQLDAKIQAGDEEDEYEYFADPKTGLTVRVNFEQSDRGKWVEATDIEFKARRNQYDDDTVDEQPDLDSLLVATPYDKLKRLFLQTPEEDEEDEAGEDRPTRRSASGAKKGTGEDRKTASAKEKRRQPPDDTPTADDAGLEEGDQVEYDGGLCEIMRISKDGTSLMLEDEDGVVIKAVGVGEVKKPVPTKKSRTKKPSVDEDASDDDWDDDEPEEKPAPKKPAKSKAKANVPVEDEDDDWDVVDEPKEKSSPKKSKAKSKPPVDDDDDDDDWD